MRRAKIWKEESGRWICQRIGPNFEAGASWNTWEAARAAAIRWVDFHG